MRSLRDLEIIRRTNDKYHLAKDIDRLTIPSTIQDVIMARVDSLPEGPKDVLQAGSVIEREFGYELIKSVTGFPEHELLHHLSVLKDTELYERGIFPQSTYVFKHAITREVVYNSILAKRKRLLHHTIGKTIEELYRENIGDHYGALLEHYLVSESYDNAAEYARLASKKAHKTASINDAISFTEKRIACLEKLPRTEETLTQIMDARTILGMYMTQMQRFSDAVKVIDPIIHAAEERNYKRRLCQIYTIIGANEFFVRENIQNAKEYSSRPLGLANELGDMVSSVLATYNLSMALTFNCDFEEAITHARRVIDINIMGKHVWGLSVAKSLESFISYVRGDAEMSRLTGAEAVKLAEESGDIFSSSEAYSFGGTGCYCKGFFPEALECLGKGADLCERIDLPGLGIWARLHLGEVHVELGDYESAKSQYRRAADVLEKNRMFPSWTNLIRTGLTKAKVMNHERDVDLECLHSYPGVNRLKVCEGWMRRYLTEIFLIIDSNHTSEAKHWIEQAIEVHQQNGMRFYLGRDYAVYAELFKRIGNKKEAKEQLGKAIDVYRQCGADGWVTNAEKELAKLS
ncbi:MAG: hypothetical protein ACP5U1_11500 [Desulfomonilaceae bacterium]